MGKKKNNKPNSPMTREEFRERWDGDANGGGITNNDVADCAVAWGLYTTPRICPMDEVKAAVLKEAGTTT